MYEQRQHPRSSIHTAVEVIDIESGVDFRAETIDVSPHGLSFRAPMEPAVGAEMEVTLSNVGNPPAHFTVTRVEPVGNGFNVAGVLKP